MFSVSAQLKLCWIPFVNFIYSAISFYKNQHLLKKNWFFYLFAFFGGGVLLVRFFLFAVEWLLWNLFQIDIPDQIIFVFMTIPVSLALIATQHKCLIQ